MEKKKEKLTALPREGGWFYSDDGIDKLRKGGLKGRAILEERVEERIGKRRRVRVPLSREAAEAVKSVKGFIPRALFVSGAVMREVQRKARRGVSKGGK